MEAIEKTFRLREVELFRHVEGSSLALLSTVAEVVELDVGALPGSGWESDPSFVVVDRGEVELVAEDGRTRTLGEGESFGARSLLVGEPEDLEVRAAGPSRLLRIARGDLRDLLLENPEVAVDLAEAVVRSLRPTVL